VEYKVLAILDFDNVRKRMSVIVRDPEGNFALLRFICCIVTLRRKHVAD